MKITEILDSSYDVLDSICEIAKCIERGEGDHVALARAIVRLAVDHGDLIDTLKSEVSA
jgi:hypothetical protein